MTLGDVAQAATPFLPDEVRESVRVLVTGRNYLAHGFWYERIHETQSTAGRQALIQFLKDTAESFRLVSHQLDDCMDRRMKELGVPPDSLDEAFQQTLREAPPKSVKRRLLRVEERVRLTDAWLVPSAESRGKALVLRDADGSFWQLGETGLGWSFRDSPADNWRVYKGLQTMLPAEIVARPRGTKPWNYQLHISTGGLLCVTRSPDGLLDVIVKRIP